MTMMTEAARANLIRRRHESGDTYRELGKRLNLSHERARQIYQRHRAKRDVPHWSDGFSERLFRVVARKVFNTPINGDTKSMRWMRYGDWRSGSKMFSTREDVAARMVVARHAREPWWQVRGVGRKTFFEMREWVRRVGVDWRVEWPE